MDNMFNSANEHCMKSQLSCVGFFSFLCVHRVGKLVYKKTECKKLKCKKTMINFML